MCFCEPLVGTENRANCKCIHHAGLIRHAGGSKPLEKSDLPPELRPASSFTFLIYLESYEDENRLVTVHIYGDITVLPY